MKAIATTGCLLLIALLSVQQTQAGCNHCGCQHTTRKVCRVECGEKEVTEVVWGCECVDFCVPGPSELLGEKCQCGHESTCDGSHHGKHKKSLIWRPGCAEVRTKKVLVKKEVKKKVPSYKWVVEEVCNSCRSVCSQEPASPQQAVHSAETMDTAAPLVQSDAVPASSPSLRQRFTRFTSGPTRQPAAQ
jgi:hypothetical protein